MEVSGRPQLVVRGPCDKRVGVGARMIDAMNVKMANGYDNLNDDDKSVMNYYFVLGGSEPDSFNDMFTIVGMIANGLNGEGVKIKISKEHGNKGFVHNYVTTGKIKNYWTVGTRNGNPIARGAIHVDSMRFDTTNELSAKTIIHEASHKFASTADFGHIKDTQGTKLAYSVWRV